MKRITRMICGAMLMTTLLLPMGCTGSPGMDQTVRSPRVQQITIDSPTDMVLDRRGNLYISEAGSGKVYCVCPDGETVVMARDLDTPSALCLDRDGNLLVAEAGSGRILRLLPDGSQVIISGR